MIATSVVIVSVMTQADRGKGRNRGTDPSTLAGGFIRIGGHTGTPTAEVGKPEDLAAAAAPDLTPAEVKAARHKRKGRSLKLAIMGISSTVLDRGDPAYKNAVIMAGALRKKRASEYVDLHGHVSVGVSALLASASLALAASRYLYEKFAEDAGGNIGTAMLKQAASLADSARQSELAAWEMCAREGLVHRKRASQEQGIPWLAVADGGSKLGRKTNVQRQEESNASVIVENGSEVFLQEPSAPEALSLDDA